MAKMNLGLIAALALLGLHRAWANEHGELLTQRDTNPAVAQTPANENCTTDRATEEEPEVIQRGEHHYSLAFFDHFDGTQLNEDIWIYRTDNRHWSVQLPSNVEIKEGCLYLNVRREEAEDKHHTGAGIISKEIFQYGYYEARFKIPAGAGWHTSFWLKRQGDSAIEIDICESDSVQTNSYEIAFHTFPGGHQSVFGQTVRTPNMHEEFVTIACEYTPTYLKYYANGTLVKTLDLEPLAQGPVQIYLTTIGSWLGGTQAIDDSLLPSAAVFDYVKFYELVPTADPSSP